MKMALNIVFVILIVSLLAFFLLSCVGKSALSVGEDIRFDEISDFYYTIDASTNPPFFQRYRVYTADGVHIFYHERREGDHWPLTEADISESGKIELSDEEWDEFCQCLWGGSVTKRKESAESGGSGPWLYLYWERDKNDWQVFAFENLDKLYAFKKLCDRLTGLAE